MTGSPLLRLVFVLSGLLLLAVPAWRMVGRSHPAPSTSPASSRQETPSPPIDLTFTAAPGPEEIKVEISGTNVATLRPLHWPATVTLPIPLPTEGIDLVISATWKHSPEPPVHALRIQATYNSQPLTDTTFWGNASITDVVTLTPGPQP